MEGRRRSSRRHQSRRSAELLSTIKIFVLLTVFSLAGSIVLNIIIEIVIKEGGLSPIDEDELSIITFVVTFLTLWFLYLRHMRKK